MKIKKLLETITKKRDADVYNEDIKDVFAKHQIAIAKKTLRMRPEFVSIMGGMTREEAKEILRKYNVPFKECEINKELSEAGKNYTVQFFYTIPVKADDATIAEEKAREQLEKLLQNSQLTADDFEVGNKSF